MSISVVLLRTLGTLSKIPVVPEISSLDLAFINKDGKIQTDCPSPGEKCKRGKLGDWGCGGGKTWVNREGNIIFKE